MPNYEAGYNMGTINVWFSIDGGSYTSMGSTASNVNSNRNISASNITSGLKFNTFSVPVYCHNQWHSDACSNNGARIVNQSLVMSWKVSNPSGTQVGSGDFTTTTNVSMSWSGNGATGTWTSNTSEKDLLSGVTASTSANQTYTMDFWYKFQCHMYNSSGNDWGSDVNVWYPGNSQNFKYQFTIPRTTLTVNTSGDDGTATASSGISSSIALNTNYTLTASEITGYDFTGWTTSDGSITITNASSRTSATVKFTSFTSATITANYTPTNYTITYNNMDGATNHASNPSNYNIESGVITLHSPTKIGYIFGGWYSNSGLSTPASSIAAGSTGNKVFYAKWIEITLTELSSSPSNGGTGVQTMTVSFKTNVPRDGGYYYRVAEFGGVNAGTTGGGYHLNNMAITSGDASTPITSSEFSTIFFNSSGIYTSAVEIYKGDDVHKRVTFTYGAGSYYTVSFNMNGHGSAISNQSVLSGGTAATPSPAPTATGYTFGGWYEEAGCTNAFNFSTAITADKTLYAKWTPKTTTVTLDKQSGTGGPATVTATYDAAMPSATMPTRDGYTFGGYYTETNGGGTQYYTNTGASARTWNFEDAAKTLYAKWTETKYDVTVSCTNPTAGDFAMAGTYQVGNVTAVRLAAGAPNSGYKWGTWLLGDGVTLVSGSLTNSGEIYVKATKNSTVTFTYDENLESEWIVAGGDKIVTTGTTWRTTADANNKMLKKPGHSTESVVYFTVPVSAICEGDNNGHYQFKIYNTSTGNWYGLGADGSSYHLLKAEDGTEKSLNGNKNIELRAYILGDYEFKLDYSTATPKLTVTWPSVNQLQIYTANESSTGDAAIGNWSWDGTSGTISTKELTLQAKTQYKFKVIYNSDFYGFKTADNPTNPMTIADHTDWRLYDDGGNCYLYAPVTGTYTFRFNSNNSGNTTLTVDFPEASRIIYGVGTLPGGGAVTVSPSFSSEDYVLKTQAITFTRGDLVAGYAWKGWYNNAEGTGVALGTGATYTSAADTRANNTDFAVYACYDYATYSITLDQTGRATAGSQTSVTGTYNSAMPDISGAGKLPTAPDGYCFMGYWDAANGEGTQYYNANGTSAHVWDKTATATLYAYFKKAEIVSFTGMSAAYQPGATVSATANISPSPEGTTIICWRVLHDNDTPLDPQPGFTPPTGSGSSISFPAMATSGNYKLEATLRTGDACGGGTELSTYRKEFNVAGSHDVTILYKHGDVVIKTATVQSIAAYEATAIEAPDIVGFNFSSWTLGEGITKQSGNLDDANITVTAIYTSTITANYTPKRMIYFKNTLGWSGVNVYFYRNNKYWGYGSNDGKGTGSSTTWTKDATTPFISGAAMTQIEGTDIWYYDCEGNSIGADVENVAFTETLQNNYDYFYSTKVVRRGDYKSSLPMFVPLEQTPVTQNTTALYYNEGYWMNYPENTGYRLRIYNNSSADNSTGASREYYFPYSADLQMPLKLDVELNDAGSIWFMVYRNDNVLMGKNYTITQDYHETKLDKPSINKLKLNPSAPGVYSFTLSFHDNGGSPKSYDYYINVDYPVSVGDYRIYYTDNATWSQGSAHGAGWAHPSDIIRKNTGSEAAADTVSLFVSHGSSPSAKFQYVSAINASTGVITWTDVTGGTIDLSGITEKGVYNFIVSQPAGGESIEMSKTEKYTGNYYIRTDCAGNTKWDSYRAQDHQMTYTEFSMSDANSFGDKFSHYYAHWCPAGTNIKFCIANDYSVCISDTLTQDVGNLFDNIDSGGFLKSDGNSNATVNIYSANVRFMYNETTNKISRAYVSAASNKSRQFLVLKGNNTMLNEDNSALSGEGESAANHEAIFVDNENFIYERILKIIPGTRFKLYACYAKNPIDVTKAQYFRGAYDSGNFTTDDNSVVLLSGSGDAQKLRVIYDFKTNRLVAAWMPSDADVSGVLKIDADVMILRDHQEAAECITFANGESKLNGVKTVYGAMKFNRWTLNNRARGEGGVEDNDKDHCDTPEDITRYHAILSSGEQKSIYERSLYFISFPFDVKLSEVFGFGQYGTHWVIQYYDGLNRARNGYWLDSPPNWKYVSPAEVAQGYTLNAYQGYLLNINLNKMAYDDNTFWANNISNVELYFPSKTSMSSIKQTEVTIPALEEEYRCTINRGTAEGDRRIKDSFWRCIGVPSYNEFAGELKSGNSSGSTIAWQTSYNTFPFLYVWNMSDNTLTAQSTSNFSFQPMHAYLVQIQDAIYWNMVSATPASTVARRVAKEAESEYSWRLALSRDSLFEDQTYIRMSDIEQITDSFDFGQDLVKELNSRSNLYTYIGYEKVAANSMPIEREQTTVVPVGVTIKNAGEYTFAMPDGTNGVGVTLVDTEANVRTSLSALDYTVSLEAGEYTGRFVLEISPVQNTPTDIEAVSVQPSEVRKVMIDGILYIVKDGKMYDARGARVE